MNYESVDDVPQLTIGPLKARCMICPGAQKGFLHFTFEDTTARVSVDKKEIGSVSGAVGGSIDLTDNASGLSFTIEAKTLWESFQRALQTHPDYKRLISERKTK